MDISNLAIATMTMLYIKFQNSAAICILEIFKLLFLLKYKTWKALLFKIDCYGNIFDAVAMEIITLAVVAMTMLQMVSQIAIYIYLHLFHLPHLKLLEVNWLSW